LGFLIVLAIFALDQITKLCAVKFLSGSSSVPVISNVFHLTLVHNTGAAFGIFRSSPRLFIAVAFVSACVIVYLLSRRGRMFSFSGRIALYFILSGTLGNLVDRLRLGYVIDFLDFRVWPVFNVADSFITAGAVILCWSILSGKTRHASGTF